MYRMSVLVAALVAVMTVPAVAAEFYVVQDTKTKKCTVVEEKPTVETIVVVGDKTYVTKEEANAAVKTITVCEVKN